MRNPWGKETYEGPWSDADQERWTDAAKEKAGWVEKDDGSWFTSIDDFHRSFSETHMNANVFDAEMAFFADFETGNQVVEDLVLTSEVDQRVYVSAYTYDSQHIRNGECDM